MRNWWIKRGFSVAKSIVDWLFFLLTRSLMGAYSYIILFSVLKKVSNRLHVSILLEKNP